MSDEEPCTFCEILAGRLPATVVGENRLAVALMDLRQFHPGHVIVIPRTHVADIREADDETAAAVMQLVARVARAVSRCCANDGLSIWHSVGPGADQEVPHLHVHVHPRKVGDDLVRVYPSSPPTPDRAVLDELGEALRRAIASD